MTVSELIEQLKGEDPKALVYGSFKVVTLPQERVYDSKPKECLEPPDLPKEAIEFLKVYNAKSVDNQSHLPPWQRLSLKSEPKIID